MSKREYKKEIKNKSLPFHLTGRGGVSQFRLSMMEEIKGIDDKLKDSAKGADWLMILLYGIDMALVPFVLIDNSYAKFFLIVNITYLIILVALLCVRLRERNRFIAKAYIFAICVTLFFVICAVIMLTCIKRIE